MQLDELRDKRVAVWGFGREGRSVLALLRRELPALPLTLFCSAAEASAPADLMGVNPCITPPDGDALAAFDVVVKSPGISPRQPAVIDAMARGVRFTSGTALWFAAHPEARVIAVTGSKGKSTTAALIAYLLRAAGRRVALAGNIGLPLTDLWNPQPPPEHWVVELSSYQAGEAGAIDFAAVTALFPEHVDWHGDAERYFADKLVLLERARRRVLNAEDAELDARVLALSDDIRFGTEAGWHPRGEGLGRGGQRFQLPAGYPLAGRHNRMNLCAALAVVDALGLDAAALLPSLGAFQALPHRLQPLGERSGRFWVDDSIATTPQATRAALEALGERPLALIVGGFDRGLDWSVVVERLRLTPLRAVVCQGESGARIAAEIRHELPQQELIEAGDFDRAVMMACAAAGEGGTVLLSPGAPSFPRFRDFTERGRRFARLAGFDVAESGAIGALGIF